MLCLQCDSCKPGRKCAPCSGPGGNVDGCCAACSPETAEERAARYRRYDAARVRKVTTKGWSGPRSSRGGPPAALFSARLPDPADVAAAGDATLAAAKGGAGTTASGGAGTASSGAGAASGGSAGAASAGAASRPVLAPVRGFYEEPRRAREDGPSLGGVALVLGAALAARALGIRL